MQQLSGGIPFVHSSLAGEIPFLKLMIAQKLYFAARNFVVQNLWIFLRLESRIMFTMIFLDKLQYQ